MVLKGLKRRDGAEGVNHAFLIVWCDTMGHEANAKGNINYISVISY